MSRKAFASVALITLAVAGLVVVGFRANAANSPAAASGSAVPTSLVAVTKRDLTDRLDVKGTLGYGATTVVPNHLGGTVTAVGAPSPESASVRDHLIGGNHRLMLMFGAIPAYRDFSLGMSDGPDVVELEQNLLALGYGNSSNLTASGHFDSFDVAAIKRWQKAVGLAQDGLIPLGRVVFEPGAVRINAKKVDVGASVGPAQDVMEVSSIQHMVTIDLDARRQNLAVAGASVTVALPSGQVVPGKISGVGKVATAPSSGSGPATIKVYVTLDDTKAGGDVDQAPVTVGLASQTKKAVLVVPINALLVLSGGGYGVEVDHNSVRQKVPVTTGLFAEGMVEISGQGISEGTMVVVPKA